MKEASIYKDTVKEDALKNSLRQMRKNIICCNILMYKYLYKYHVQNTLYGSDTIEI